MYKRQFYDLIQTLKLGYIETVLNVAQNNFRLQLLHFLIVLVYMTDRIKILLQNENNSNSSNRCDQPFLENITCVRDVIMTSAVPYTKIIIIIPAVVFTHFPEATQKWLNSHLPLLFVHPKIFFNLTEYN